jgi:hypothetical protein
MPDDTTPEPRPCSGDDGFCDTHGYHRTPPAPDSAPATGHGRTCDATTSGGTQHPITLGPCTRDRGHDTHRDARGDTWYSPGQDDARQRAEKAEGELAAFHEGEEPYEDEATVPTPAQWIWHWNRATPARRLEVIEGIQTAQDNARRCSFEYHDAMLAELRETLRRANRELEQAATKWDADLDKRTAALAERAEQAEARIARVRDLHVRSDKRRPLDLSLTPIIHCAHCNNDWPCDTIRALDSVETTRSENAAGPMSQTPR